MNRTDIKQDEFVDVDWHIKRISLHQKEAENHPDKEVRDKWALWLWNAIT